MRAMQPAAPKLLALAALSLVSLGASCDRGPKTASSASQGAPQAPRERVEHLDGVDVSELTEAEVQLWTTLINEQLSPCGDPSSVARCAVEKRKCAGCMTAARYLTRLVTEGYDKQTIEQHYAGRFGKQTRAEIRTEGAKVRGAPMAPVTIVEFSDFQCPYCGAAHPEIARLMREFEGQVKLVFKSFPLSAHERAMPAACAAEAAARQNKFWEMHDLLFAHQHELEDADLVRYAGMLGLDVERFKTDLGGSEVKERVEADRKEGEKLNIQGTPTIYVNGRLLREPVKALQAYLKEELEL
jgi:predicted DsbA family dithiol-disulfide isomerase